MSLRMQAAQGGGGGTPLGDSSPDLQSLDPVCAQLPFAIQGRYLGQTKVLLHVNHGQPGTPRGTGQRGPSEEGAEETAAWEAELAGGEGGEGHRPGSEGKRSG